MKRWALCLLYLAVGTLAVKPAEPLVLAEPAEVVPEFSPDYLKQLGQHDATLRAIDVCAWAG